MLGVPRDLVVVGVISGVLQYPPKRCAAEVSPCPTWDLYLVLSTSSEDFNKSDNV